MFSQISRIIHQFRLTLYQIPPKTYGFIILGLALWLITTAFSGLASLVPEILSNEEVEIFW